MEHSKMGIKKSIKIQTYFNYFVFIILSVVLYFSFHTIERCSYQFLNSDFVCNKKAVLNKKEYTQLKYDIEKYIDLEQKTSNIFNISVYFRDLVSGPVMGINEFENFAPASLLKLPFALVYFIEKESSHKITFEDVISFSKNVSLPSQYFTSRFNLLEGNQYSIEDLLRRMISYSDNEASAMLWTHLENNGRPDALRNTLLDLGILLSNDPYDKSISVRKYASIFRGLYNASLINVSDSEKLLSWLAQSDFKNGLLAQLPKDITVAHKFGERELADGTKQLHDCGIIYYPENPYLLCVMTHGDSYKDLERIIQNISGKVYREVDSRKL